MARTRTTWHRAVLRVVLLVLLVLLAAPLMLALQVHRSGPRPHELDVGVSAPALVAQAVAERAAGLEGDPFEVVALPEEAAPRAGVRDGLLDAVVAIDFRESEDVLYVSTTTSDPLVAEMRVRMAAVSSTYGRTLRTTTVEPARSPGTWRGAPYLLVVVWVVLGLGVAVGLSLLLGPIVRDTRHALGRLVVLSGLSLLAGLLVWLVVGRWAEATLVGTGATGMLTVAATAWLVLALEALLGVRGVGIAVAFLLALLAPVLTFAEPTGLPWPWPWVMSWSPTGAALELARNDVFFGADLGWQPLAVIGSWIVVALLTLASARRERPLPVGAAPGAG